MILDEEFVPDHIRQLDLRRVSRKLWGTFELLFVTI